ncbi:MAG TPA: hypothetical protein VF748_07455 [Candidatus Acidoferrum sp.]
MNNPVGAANQRAMDRYQRTVTIERLPEGDVWVTLDGVHYHNDEAKLEEAIMRIKAR